MHFVAALILVFYAAISYGIPTTSSSLSLIYQFPNETWVENIAVRSNGNLLVTLILPFAGLYEINPNVNPPTPVLIRNFTSTEGLNSLFGITEDASDIFYVAGSDFNASTEETTPGSNFIFKIDYSCSLCSVKPSVSTLVNVKNATLINGLTTARQGLLFGADSKQGVVWEINTTSGQYFKAIDDPLFKIPSSGARIGLGLNGIKTSKNTLYFTNSATSIFGKLQYNQNGQATTTAVKVFDLSPDLPDDFVLSENGVKAYVTDANGNTLVEINLSSAHATTLAGSLNSTTLAQPAGAALGRVKADSKIVYVTTAGGAGAPVNGDVIVGGQVVAVYI